MLLQKTYEAQSKLKYYMELKNNLFNLFEYLDGDQGKVN